MAATSLVAAIVSCSKKPDAKVPADALARVGSEYLTRSQLSAAMPGGLSPDDSAKFANAYIRSWIDNCLLTQVAVHEIDMTEIDRLVKQYRNDLIMWEYTKQMYDSHPADPVSDDSLKNYYNQHINDYKLDRPMVKGVYIKVADDAKSLPSLRKLYRSTRPEDIDKLDKNQLSGAVHYDYFRDNWVDWQRIESIIPYDFGADSDRFLRSKDHIDFTIDGFTYLLDISDVLHAGQTMPFEAAKPLILERMSYSNRRNYSNRLRQQLYDRAINDGDIEIFDN